MQRFLIPLILLVCLNASADRVLETTDLKNTCWITQPELVFKDRHAVFIFRDDGTGERRGFSHGGWRGTSALNWNINNGVLGYTFQEPQAGYNPRPGSGLRRSATISDDQNFISIVRVQGSPFYRISCDGLL